MCIKKVLFWSLSSQKILVVLQSVLSSTCITRVNKSELVYLKLFLRHHKAERIDYLMQVFFSDQSHSFSVKRGKGLVIKA